MVCWKCLESDNIVELLEERHSHEVAYLRWKCKCGVNNYSRIFMPKSLRKTRGLLVLGGNLYASDVDKYMFESTYCTYLDKFDYVVTTGRRGVELFSIYTMHKLNKRAIVITPTTIPDNIAYLKNTDNTMIVPHVEYVNSKHPIYEKWGNANYQTNRFAPYLQSVFECIALADEALIFDNNMPNEDVMKLLSCSNIKYTTGYLANDDEESDKLYYKKSCVIF